MLPLAQVLKNLGSDAAWVVHGSDGLDEITITGPTSVAALENGSEPVFSRTRESILNLGDFAQELAEYNQGQPAANVIVLVDAVISDRLSEAA